MIFVFFIIIILNEIIDDFHRMTQKLILMTKYTTQFSSILECPHFPLYMYVFFSPFHQNPNVNNDKMATRGAKKKEANKKKTCNKYKCVRNKCKIKRTREQKKKNRNYMRSATYKYMYVHNYPKIFSLWYV